MPYYTYILSSLSRALYTGVTNDLVRRVADHRRGAVRGHTERYRIARLVYFETSGDIRAAIVREKQIKAWTRAKRVALIEAHNPEWLELSRDWLSPARRSVGPSLRSG